MLLCSRVRWRRILFFTIFRSFGLAPALRGFGALAKELQNAGDKLCKKLARAFPTGDLGKCLFGAALRTEESGSKTELHKVEKLGDDQVFSQTDQSDFLARAGFLSHVGLSALSLSLQVRGERGTPCG